MVLPGDVETPASWVWSRRSAAELREDWSARPDLNGRSPVPQTGAFAGLSYGLMGPPPGHDPGASRLQGGRST